MHRTDFNKETHPVSSTLMHLYEFKQLLQYRDLTVINFSRWLDFVYKVDDKATIK